MKNYFFLAYLLLTTQVYAQWTPINIPTKASFRALKSLGNHIWAGGTQGTVGHSEDGGKTWQFQQIPGAEKLDFRDLAIQNAKEKVQWYNSRTGNYILLVFPPTPTVEVEGEGGGGEF